MNTIKNSGKWLIFPAVSLGVIAAYFLLFRKLLGTAGATIELIVLGGLSLIAVVTLLLGLITLLRAAFSKDRGRLFAKKLGGCMIFLLIIAALIAAIVLGSQWTAHTAPILGADGAPLPGSIAKLEKVKLGGVNQWLITRGQNVNKPVLLFLSGGPGASEAARVIRFNRELEKHFVVVIWEQRGCGKSYPSINPKSNLTIQQYTDDVIELAKMLCTRFDEQKIYLLGHSWGSIIGVRAVQERPELFHAYIGSAQMVDVLETDRMIYDMVLKQGKADNKTIVKTLQAQGEPPYFGKSPIKPYATLFGYEYALYEAPNIKDAEYRRDGDILEMMLKQSEYGWLDRVYYLLGLMNTFNVVYPQLQDMDFRLDALHFDLPVYMILGCHDMNNPYAIPEEYFNLLEAPSKQLFFFEDSGHGMIWEERDSFHNLMINTVLPETYR